MCCIFSGTAKVIDLGACVPLDFQRMLWMYKPADCTYPWRGWLLTSEAILLFSKGKPKRWLEPGNGFDHDCYIHRRVGMEEVEGHPTVKPLWVIRKLVRHIEGRVLDCYLGSGTTAVACEREGRRWIGAEINPEYAAIAQKRIDRERAQMKLDIGGL